MNIELITLHKYKTQDIEAFAVAEGITLHSVSDFFDINLFVLIQGRIASDTGLVFVNYPIDSSTELELIKEFIDYNKTGSSNSYYFPTPNDFFIPSNFALAFIVSANCLEHWMIEYLYTNKLLELSARNQSHERLHKRLGVTNSSIPKQLMNISTQWKQWKNTPVKRATHLINKIKFFYPTPKNIFVMTSNQCNLSCVMCPYHSPVYKPNHTSGYFQYHEKLSMQTFKKLADYAGKHGVYLQFGQIEEALLHEELVDFIRYAKEQNVPNIHLTTNGTLLTESKSIELLESGLDSITFSIDAYSPETYKLIRGGNLDILEKKIQRFIELAQDYTISTSAAFILQEDAMSEQALFLDKWRELGINKVIYYAHTQHDLKTGMTMVDNSFIDYDKRYPCASPWQLSAMLPNGDITLCCESMVTIGWEGKITAGNINEMTFDEIWASKAYSTLRHELLQNKFDTYKICEGCKIWSSSNYITEDKAEWTKTYNETMQTYVFK